LPPALNKEEISSFLHFGYIPQVPDDVYQQPWAEDQFETKRNVLEKLSEPQLIDKGVNALKAAFYNIPKGKHIVLLSGGLDSRAILGGLLDAGLKDQITTVTFGTPGTFDYDIGCYVAKQMGVRHETIDLTQVKLEQEFFEKTAKEVGEWIWLFDVFYIRLIGKRFGEDAIYWSGFMGDPLAGSHLLSKDSESWDVALGKFAERGRFSRSIDLTHPGFCLKEMLPQYPILDQNCLCYDEQLDFAIRQQFYIRTLVLPKDHKYKTPFLHPDWVKFILSVPRRYRVNQCLYIEILKKANPKLFLLPVKANLGLSYEASRLRKLTRKVKLKLHSSCRKYLPQIYRGVSPKINYIDFDWALRNRKDMKTVVFENIQDLKKRGIVDWIDIDGIWKRHQEREANHSDELTLLTSLEIYLKIKKQI
jgi:Asparagine synthase